MKGYIVHRKAEFPRVYLRTTAADDPQQHTKSRLIVYIRVFFGQTVRLPAVFCLRRAFVLVCFFSSHIAYHLNAHTATHSTHKAYTRHTHRTRSILLRFPYQIKQKKENTVYTMCIIYKSNKDVCIHWVYSGYYSGVLGVLSVYTLYNYSNIDIEQRCLFFSQSCISCIPVMQINHY